MVVVVAVVVVVVETQTFLVAVPEYLHPPRVRSVACRGQPPDMYCTGKV